MRQLLAAGLAVIAVFAGSFAVAQEAGTEAKAAAEPWPFDTKAPEDPALGLLTKVETLKVEVTESDPKLIKITVEAIAPRSGYTSLELADKPGRLNDKVFAFDARGRPPQTPSEEEKPTEVTLGGTYQGAPIDSIDTIEIYAQDNCRAYSLPQKREVECRTNLPAESKSL